MSREKSTATAPGIAVLASFPGQLASGTRPGPQKAVAQENAPHTAIPGAAAQQPQCPPHCVFRGFKKVLTHRENRANARVDPHGMSVDVCTLRHLHVPCHLKPSRNNRSYLQYSTKHPLTRAWNFGIFMRISVEASDESIPIPRDTSQEFL